MAVSREQYQQLLKREQGRAGTNRDEAVRRANIAAGFGNSTAQRFMGAPAAKAAPSGGGAARSTSPYKLPKKAPRPTPRPDMTKTSSTQPVGPSDPGEDRATRFRQDPWSAAVGNTANPYGGFSPDLAPSPNPYQMGSPVNPRTMPAGPNPFSPDLAPSPNPYAMGSPVNPHPLAMPQPIVAPRPGGNAVMGLGSPSPMGSTSPILGQNRPVIDINKLFGY